MNIPPPSFLLPLWHCTCMTHTHKTEKLGRDYISYIFMSFCFGFNACFYNSFIKVLLLLSVFAFPPSHLSTIPPSPTISIHSMVSYPFCPFPHHIHSLYGFLSILSRPSLYPFTLWFLIHSVPSLTHFIITHLLT